MTSVDDKNKLQRSDGSFHNLFLSHAWGTDLRGRNTHERVKLIKNELQNLGWKLWFDEEKLLLGCNVDTNMANGIKNSDAVCVCITRTYVEKINSQHSGDNCAKEWNFAQSIGKKILPLILEEEMLDVKAWPQGIMSMYLGNTFYIDCSGDNIKEISKRLSSMLNLLGLQKRPLRSKNHSWPLLKKSKSLRVLKKSSSNLSSFIKI